MSQIFLFGDHIDTDVIIPGRFCSTIDANELAKHCMYDLDEKFYSKVKHGDVIVAGENFGCGSSREVAPLAIQYCGIECIIAASFSRIFYRNAINIGLQLIEDKEFCKHCKNGDHIQINENRIRNMTTGYESERRQQENAVLDEIRKAKNLMNVIPRIRMRMTNEPK